MSTPDIPLLDISVWRSGSAAARDAFARRMDGALRQSGFLLIEGHGIDPGLPAAIRAEAARFFALPERLKQRYSAPVGGRGWIRPGGEANAFYGERADPRRADLKESLTMGRTFTSGDPATDAEWFTANVYPAECPDLGPLCERYAAEVRGLYLELLEACAAALGLARDFFTSRARRSPHTFNVNRYPPMAQTGAPLAGQFRVAPHTDWGMLTILDRQPGYGGLQVKVPDGEWADAPYEPGAFTINVGDILARWTAGRWRSIRHRVLPPSSRDPDEELVSLILFHEADMDTIVEPLFPGTSFQPVTAADYLRERIAAASVA
ncbi:MAG TPA: 2-oxoglutarate and iron-dependent oxygenase domain-containing protein [Trebonia sp.]|nr:2-oxoglutarate and iron-dependent oxygenase domain-containing protein [Trebonia sp.]